ncbi:MAG: PD40 domain-containing protein [Ignavibacteriales bacterium]|nr:PD40 domain-containing protein [Ignavibacteriales bacterium]
MIVGVILAFTAVNCDPPPGPEQIQVSYAHYWAVWSPDGATFAFLASINNTQGIYAVDSSGSDLRVVFAGAVGGPTWSADSKWLAFSRQLDIWKVKATGDSAQQLTDGGGDARPSWSSDGRTIAFFRDGVWLLEVETDSLRLLNEFGDHPSWHPNGTEVVMMATSGGGTVSTFYAVHRDSGTVRQLSTVSGGGYCDFPKISPGGSEVVFSLTPFSGITQIWKVDIVSGGAQQLTQDGGDFASWSPDGNRIVYTRTTYGDGALWVMNADGSGKTRLTTP